MKPTLLIHEAEMSRSATLGARYLLNALIKSDLFSIGYHHHKIHCFKAARSTLLFYNGRAVFLDLWEYPTPTHTMEVLHNDLDLIIKLQHRDAPLDHFLGFCERKNPFPDVSPEKLAEFWSKIVPWTFFPSRMMEEYTVAETEFAPLESKNLCFFCGKDWKARRHIKASFERQNLEYTSSLQAVANSRVYSDEEFLEKMRTCKYGVALHGRLSPITEGKNRREADYLFLGKPLLCNYSPYYYNPLVHGKHYIHFDHNTDIKDLENQYDIEQIAKDGHQWYLENMSPMGIAKSFLKIMTDKFGTD